MNLLFDTHVLLWAAGSPERISRRVRTLIENRENGLVFSVASIWEIVIKRSLGRRDFRVDPQRLRRKLVENGYDELPIGGEHVLGVAALPAVHQDPFDRLLLAQAIHEGLALVTADRALARYPASIVVA